MEVKRTDVQLRPDSARVLFRPFEPEDPARTTRILARIMELPEPEVDARLKGVLAEFRPRHQKPLQFFLARFEAVKGNLLTDRRLSENRKLLIGAYFTHEYSLESAALFNPSIVWHPDQSGLPPGARRFVLSLRATGEGHISSITFRSGVIDAENRITVDPATRFVSAPEAAPHGAYDKGLFRRKLDELGLVNGFVDQVLDSLDESFSLGELEGSIRSVMRQHRSLREQWAPLAKSVTELAKSNYEVVYSPEEHLSERTIFPYAPTETNGIEDARFVHFHDDDGSARYYATYTAFDGRVVFPQLLETEDFLRFRINTLNGPEVRNKGMALFPRKIGGLYAMLSRQDGENLYLMYSEMLHFWYTKQILLRPTFPWEMVLVGNCGSPIETEAGWLVLSHGVGPMRKYSIGAVLLDLEDPGKVIGRLDEPLLTPNENEREGYVPNVVYSCGAILHGRELVIPYAMSDYATTFATVPLDALLNRLKTCGNGSC